MPPPGNDNGWERWRGEVSATLRNIEAKVTEFQASLSEHAQEDDERFDKLSDSTDKLQKHITRWAGGGVVVLVVLGWLVPLVFDWLRRV